MAIFVGGCDTCMTQCITNQGNRRAFVERMGSMGMAEPVRRDARPGDQFSLLICFLISCNARADRRSLHNPIDLAAVSRTRAYRCQCVNLYALLLPTVSTCLSGAWAVSWSNNLILAIVADCEQSRGTPVLRRSETACSALSSMNISCLPETSPCSVTRYRRARPATFP